MGTRANEIFTKKLQVCTVASCCNIYLANVSKCYIIKTFFVSLSDHTFSRSRAIPSQVDRQKHISLGLPIRQSQNKIIRC